jgi:hypothetical protein
METLDNYPELDDLCAGFNNPVEYDNSAWSCSSAYHGFLLRNLTPGCRTALEIGCGSGAFASLVAVTTVWPRSPHCTISTQQLLWRAWLSCYDPAERC